MDVPTEKNKYINVCPIFYKSKTKGISMYSKQSRMVCEVPNPCWLEFLSPAILVVRRSTDYYGPLMINGCMCEHASMIILALCESYSGDFEGNRKPPPKCRATPPTHCFQMGFFIWATFPLDKSMVTVFKLQWKAFESEITDKTFWQNHVKYVSLFQ